MAAQTLFLGSQTQGFEQQIVILYGWTCRQLFGKTLSVMAGQAEEQGKWYGCHCCIFVNFLLRDPRHCADELKKFQQLCVIVSSNHAF